MSLGVTLCVCLRVLRAVNITYRLRAALVSAAKVMLNFLTDHVVISHVHRMFAERKMHHTCTEAQIKNQRHLK